MLLEEVSRVIPKCLRVRALQTLLERRWSLLVPMVSRWVPPADMAQGGFLCRERLEVPYRFVVVDYGVKQGGPDKRVKLENTMAGHQCNEQVVSAAKF